jgi:hypothetical protein
MQPSAAPERIPNAVLLAVLLAVAAGIALRFAYPLDIEYKADERWSFDQARAVLQGALWPWFGMPMSVGGLNPGMSLWVFVGLMWASGAATPPELAAAVQALNAAALIALLLFAWRVVPAAQREPWLWAAALWAVNPVAVILERKIWSPSVLPLFIVALIAAWWRRRGAVGSFLFGLLAALLAQIHLSVAFLAAAMLLWGLMSDRSSWRWPPLFAGAVLGALPAIPWLADTLQSAGAEGRWRLPILHFWLRWLTQPFGFGAEYTLGLAHFREFLSLPFIAGVPTHLVALLHAALAALAIAVYALAGRALWSRPPTVREILVGSDATGALLRAAFIGYGVLMTLLTIRGAGAHRHYLIIVAPLMALFVARLVALGDGGELKRSGRLMLAAMCLAGALVSASLLRYIHVTQVIRGEYGPTWAAQQSGLAPPAPAIVVPPRVRP